MEKDSNQKTIASAFTGVARYTALAAAIGLCSNAANGQLLHNLTIGNPKALALGNAVTADPPGIDSIHFNPAGLSKIKGRQLNVKFLMAHMNMDAEIGVPTKPEFDSLDSFYRVKYNSGNPGNCNQTDPGPPGAPNDIPMDELIACWGEDPLANTSSSSSGPALMLPFVGMTEVPILGFPSGGVAFEDPSRGWTFGTAVYSPQGIGYMRDEDDSGAYQGIGVGVTRLTYFSPTIAIPVSNELSFGVGVNFSYQGLGLDTKIRAPLETTRFLEGLEEIAEEAGLELHVLQPYDTVGRLSLEVEDFLSVGFNFGILYEPYDWLSFGFLYQSETTSNLEGDYKMENTVQFAETAHGLADTGLDLVLAVIANGAPFNAGDYAAAQTYTESGTVELEYIMPQNIAFGTSIKLLPNLKINIDAKWIEYSVWDELAFKFSDNVDYLTLSSVIYSLSGLPSNADPDEMRIQRNYDDVWSFAIGGEYQLNDNVVLRAGYEPRTGAIPKGSADLLFPIGDADLFTFGFGLQLDSTSRIDGAFGYLYSEQKIAACESSNANTCTEGDVVYNPYYSMPFETETSAYIVSISYDQKF